MIACRLISGNSSEKTSNEIGLSVTFSPQWVLWLAPLCLPLARRNWLLTALIMALDLATYFTFPVFSPIWGSFDAGGVDRAVYVRFAVLAFLAVMLLWQDQPFVAATIPQKDA